MICSLLATDAEARAASTGALGLVVRPVVFPMRIVAEYGKAARDAYDVVMADDRRSATFLVVGDHGFTDWVDCPMGGPGDVVAVKEAYALLWPGEGPPDDDGDLLVEYRADDDSGRRPGQWPSEERRHPECPRWGSSARMRPEHVRSHVRVLGVDVRHVDFITCEEARAAGVSASGNAWHIDGIMASTARQAFEMWWDRRYSKRGLGWNESAWCWFVNVEAAEERRKR
jgi:hypothetical protein